MVGVGLGRQVAVRGYSFLFLFLLLFILLLLWRVGMGFSALWVAAWAGAGYSFADWRQRQEAEYLKRLQFLIDRKDRRDKWDAVYFGAQSQEKA